jgi:2-amino-4-hydroxy-6-hydroxymethyldihydropteridine diphosphokinase
MKKHVFEVCILLGSNIDSEKNIKLAIKLIGEKLQINKISSVWESKAVGSNGPNYLNVALLANTTLNEEDLKNSVLRKIETKLGRVRGENKFADREIDLDIIFFNHKLLDNSLFKNEHILIPVSQILPAYKDEDSNTLKQLALRKKSSIVLRNGIL